ncbi:hypothetical protein DMENIID0001_164370 [Sergentomyia squamirostris]
MFWNVRRRQPTPAIFEVISGNPDIFASSRSIRENENDSNRYNTNEGINYRNISKFIRCYLTTPRRKKM